MKTLQRPFLIILLGFGISSASLAQDQASDQTPEQTPDYVLICKAKKSRFNFDWSAASIGNEQIDQNSVRYQFKPATKPAGERGENLKVGECGWARRALANSKKPSAEFVMKSLSNETTEAFYRMKTGRVFKLPVRQSANGMVVLPKAEVSVVR